MSSSRRPALSILSLNQALVGALIAAIVAQACSAQQGDVRVEREVRASSPSAQAAAVVESYIDAYLDGEPGRAREVGLHAYDGKVAEISPAEVMKRVEQARWMVDQVSKLDLATIEDPTRLDLELARLSAERTVFEIEVLRRPYRILGADVMFDVSSYLVRNYAPLEERVTSLLDQVERATEETAPLLKMLDEKEPRTHLETARKILAGMHDYYDGDVRREAAPALEKDPKLKTRFERVIGEGLAAVDRLIAWIDGVGMKNATDDFALGEANLLRMLEVNEGLTIDLATLDRMAKDDLKRNYDAFVAVAKEIDPKLDVKGVAAKVASERLTQDRVLETAGKQLEQTLAFIQEKQIVSIGGDERAMVAVTPPFQRWNSAFLNASGPFEKAKGSFYYISPPDPSWPKDMQDAYLPYEGDLLSTSTHEVYPGHFIQGLHQKAASTRAQRIFDSYAFVEGWAHYGEEMMFEEGLGKDDPRLKLGQLSNALLRDCRFVATLGLHVRGMSVKEADRLFQDQCFVDPGNALQQAYRGTFDPGYLSYTLGKLQITELRRAFFEKYKTKSLREFHDWLLSFGAAPIALIRERL